MWYVIVADDSPFSVDYQYFSINRQFELQYVPNDRCHNDHECCLPLSLSPSCTHFIVSNLSLVNKAKDNFFVLKHKGALSCGSLLNEYLLVCATMIVWKKFIECWSVSSILNLKQHLYYCFFYWIAQRMSYASLVFFCAMSRKRRGLSVLCFINPSVVGCMWWKCWFNFTKLNLIYDF